MNKGNRNFSARAKAAAAALLAAALLALPAFAAQTTLDRARTGSLTLELAEDGKRLTGGVFDVYLVATPDDAPELHYTLSDAFAGAGKAYGLDLNGLSTASELLGAADTLSRYTSNAQRTARLRTYRGTASVSGLALGVYLVVQTGAPENYTASLPFLVFVPMTDPAGGGWIYDCTAYPKVSYSPPSDRTVEISVTKVWEDGGYRIAHPAVWIALYRNGERYETRSLSRDNGWSTDWSGLSAGSVWTVRELTELPSYISRITHAGGSYTITNVLHDTPPSRPQTPGGTTTINEDDLPLSAPQTGMLQWPIPVLAAAGALFLAAGILQKKKAAHGA